MNFKKVLNCGQAKLEQSVSNQGKVLPLLLQQQNISILHCMSIKTTFYRVYGLILWAPYKASWWFQLHFHCTYVHYRIQVGRRVTISLQLLDVVQHTLPSHRFLSSLLDVESNPCSLTSPCLHSDGSSAWIIILLQLCIKLCQLYCIM